MSFKIKTNSFILIFLILQVYSADLRYFEQDLDKSDPHYMELIPRFTKYAKVEREYRFPKKNLTKKEQLYEITKNKQSDELNFNDSLEKFESQNNFVKIPKIQEEVYNLSEISMPVETTLEKYKPFNTEFITSRNFQKENSKQLNDEDGFFTKINTVIKNQFTKIFNPFKKDNEESNRKIGSKSFDQYFTRYGTVERVQDKPKNKRFLNIFTILQFENSRCQAQGSFLSYEGTCYHRSECNTLGGYSMGACAKGFGVCCVFRGTCGTVTNQNTTYFECENCSGSSTSTSTSTLAPPIPPTTVPTIDPRFNLSYLIEQFNFQQRQTIVPVPIVPTVVPGSSGTSPCVFTIIKKTPDVTQLRIDFLDLDIRGPTNGTCREDQVIVSGQNSNNIIPIICGYNTGQHIYADVSQVPGPIKITVILMSTQSKKFRIRVSQLRAPCANFMNCLQYYTGVEGTFSSFNYEISPTGLSTPQYFNNLNYAICIRKEPGYCTVTYTNVQNGVEAPFDIRNVDIRGIPLIPPNQAGAEIFNCPDDFIVVNGIRLCGGKLNDGSTTEDLTRNAPVTDLSAGPIVLPFRTNNTVVGRGFKLYYRQNRCTI